MTPGVTYMRSATLRGNEVLPAQRELPGSWPNLEWRSDMGHGSCRLFWVRV